MFFDHNTIHRGATIVETANQDFISDNINEDLYNPTFQSEDMWKKFPLPTPPYSPETYSSTSKNHVFNQHPQNNLQVVPDDFPEDLSSDLPMVLSDAEMERLTSSTLANDCVWNEQDLDPNTIPHIRAPICQLDTMRESQTLYSQPEKHFPEYHTFPQGLPVQENCINQQQSPQNWAPYAGKSLSVVYSASFESNNVLIARAHSNLVEFNLKRSLEHQFCIRSCHWEFGHCLVECLCIDSALCSSSYL
jgi:hypothetical protein